MKLPTSLGQDRLDRLYRAEDSAMFDPNDTSVPMGLNDLGLEQLRLGPRARLWLGTFGLAALRLNSHPIMSWVTNAVSSPASHRSGVSRAFAAHDPRLKKASDTRWLSFAWVLHHFAMPGDNPIGHGNNLL